MGAPLWLASPLSTSSSSSCLSPSSSSTSSCSLSSTTRRTWQTCAFPRPKRVWTPWTSSSLPHEPQLFFCNFGKQSESLTRRWVLEQGLGQSWTWDSRPLCGKHNRRNPKNNTPVEPKPRTHQPGNRANPHTQAVVRFREWLCSFFTSKPICEGNVRKRRVQFVFEFVF